MHTKTLIIFAVFCFLLGRYSKEPNAYSYKKTNYLSETDEPSERTQNTIDILHLINSERIRNNLKSINTDIKLFCTAQQYSKEISTKKICKNQNTEIVLIKGRKCGVQTTNAQIIACNEPYVDRVIKTWMSTDNRYVILNKNYTKIGCDEKNGYWVCVFSI